MADDSDLVKDWVDKSTDKTVDRIRSAAAQMPMGNAGECYYCGEYFIRLVGGACGRCRDARDLR